MENLIADFVYFSCYCQIFILQWTLGRRAKPVLKFEIFLNFSHFLRSYVLSRSATHEATRTFSFW